MNKKNKNFKKEFFLTIFLVFGFVFLSFCFFQDDDDSQIKIPLNYLEDFIFENNGTNLLISPVNALDVQKKESKNGDIFEEAYPGVDVISKKEGLTLKEDIILKKKGEHPGVFKYRIKNFKDYLIEKDSEGNLNFFLKNEIGDEGLRIKVFKIPAPFMMDSAGLDTRNYYKDSNNFSSQGFLFGVGMTISDEGLLTIEPDKEWLEKADYPVILDPTVEIIVLNVHSHPAQGEDWIVEFKSRGKADLKIIPGDQETVDEDEFIGLYCGDNQLSPELLSGDVIFYPNWQCDEIARVEHYTKRAGNHKLIFEFGDQLAYAYNATPIYRSVGPSQTTTVDDDNAQTNTLTISGSTATFSSGIADNVGIGDVIIYDTNGDDTLDSSDTLVFIHGRTSTTEYTVKNADGTTPSVATSGNDKWSIYRAYTSLVNAESGTKNTSIPITFTGGNRDLVTSGEQWNIVCYNDATETSRITVDGWTTDSDNYLKIYTPTTEDEVGVSQRHTGTTGTGFKMNPSSSGHVFTISDDYIHIEGLEIANWTGSSAEAFRVNNTGFNLSNSIIHNASDSNADGVYPGANNIIIKIKNVIMYDIGRTGVHIQSSQNVTLYLYNSTFYNMKLTGQGYYPAVGFDNNGSRNNTGSVMIIKNTTAHANSGNAFHTGDNGGAFTGSDYNASHDSTAPGTTTLTSVVQSDQFISLTADSEDFHLKVGADLIDAGTDLSADSNLAFSDDIDEETRNGSWDIGADEIISNIAPTINSISDSPDPVDDGSDITFSINWSDDDTEGVMMYICKTDAVTGGAGCDGGSWCSDSNDYDLTNPLTCSYTAQSADIATSPNNYYAFVCDDSDDCSSSSSGSFSVNDITPPVRSNGTPTEKLAIGTTSTTISLGTDENATCKYATSSGVLYDSMTNTFSTTGTTSHSTNVSGLGDGNTYNYYIKCSDGAGNKNTTDYLISFSVGKINVRIKGGVKINGGVRIKD